MDPPELNWDPPQVSRAAKIPEEEWEKHRIWISDLHKNGYTLEEIISVMRYHSAQEGTFFEPTRKQYVSRLQKWDLRRYGLHQNTKEASSAPTTKARQFDGSSGEDAALSHGLRYHQSKCCWCEPASPNCPEIQQNFRLAIKHGALSEDEVSRKLDLADFYLAAKNFDDAWSLYAEALYRSYKCSDLGRLFIALKVLYSSIHFNLQGTAKDHLIHLLFMDKESPRAAAKPLWMMHLLRGVICHTRGDLNLATLHMEKAAELGDLSGDSSHEGRSLDAQRALISEVAGRLRRVKSELDGILSTLPKPPKPLGISCFYRATMFQDWSTVILLNWCLKQVEGCGYLAMLDSSVEKPWTKVPSLQSFKDFERIALFCYLWKEFREAQRTEAQRTQSQTAPSSEETIVVVVESLEQVLQIPAPMIFSTISSMGADVEMAGLPTVQPDFTLGQINRQAVENLMRLTEIDLWPSNWNNLDDRYANLFISTYASLHSDIEVTDEERQFRMSVQKFVRQFADPQFSQNENSVDPQNAYLWKITSVRGTEEVLDEENFKDNAPATQQSGSATPTAGPQPDTLLTDGESDPRPASCVSVDMLATPRSSLSSSKASLRSFKRLGRVANSLLKRGGSGANQRPSEAMDRDSHSSWSLRRLTGVSYLSGISGTPEDYEPEGDTIMGDAGLMD